MDFNETEINLLEIEQLLGIWTPRKYWTFKRAWNTEFSKDLYEPISFFCIRVQPHL